MCECNCQPSATTIVTDAAVAPKPTVVPRRKPQASAPQPELTFVPNLVDLDAERLSAYDAQVAGLEDQHVVKLAKYMVSRFRAGFTQLSQEEYDLLRNRANLAQQRKGLVLAAYAAAERLKQRVADRKAGPTAPKSPRTLYTTIGAVAKAKQAPSAPAKPAAKVNTSAFARPVGSLGTVSGENMVDNIGQLNPKPAAAKKPQEDNSKNKGKGSRKNQAA